MAYTTIKKPSSYFNTVLYTGNGSTQSITGVGFQPDWVWGKNRDTTNWHNLEDIVRGETKRLSSNSTDAEATEPNNITSFDSDGFSVGNGNNLNGNGYRIVAWNWLASNTTASNTDGSITSTVSANTTSGFSIVSYTGNSTAGATVGHGLGVAPAMMIIKNRTSSSNTWTVYHHKLSNPATKFLGLNLSGAEDTSTTNFNSTVPSSSVITLGTDAGTNGSTTMIAYCFAEKQGFSKFGSYTGNGNADGTFVYTGFKPAWVMVKNASNAFEEWGIWDSKRDVSNIVTRRLVANITAAENTSDYLDFTSNGFKIRTSANGLNQSGSNLIYMAFAEEPLVGDNPCTAR